MTDQCAVFRDLMLVSARGTELACVWFSVSDLKIRERRVSFLVQREGAAIVWEETQ